MPIRLELRGDGFLHWGFELKSLQIRFGKDERHLVHKRVLNLIKKSSSLIALLAKDLGVLSTDMKSLRCFIDGRYYGLFNTLEPPDEGFLRRNRKMPGDVYSGDFQSVKALRSVNFLMNPYVWTKNARSNVIPRDDYRYLADFIGQLNDHGLDEFRRFMEMLSWEEAVKNIGFALLMKSAHQDDLHNQKWYLNPLTGRFEPIVWDLYVDSYQKPYSEFGSRFPYINLFYKKMLLHPKFLEDIYAWCYPYFTDDTFESIAERSKREAEINDLFLQAEVYDYSHKGAGDSFLNKTLMKNLMNNRDIMKEAVENGCSMRYRILKNQDQSFSIVFVSDGIVAGELMGFTGGPFIRQITKEKNIFGGKEENLTYNNNSGSALLAVPQTLYPGRSLSGETMKTTPLLYPFRVTTEKPVVPIINNHITKKGVTAQPLTKDEWENLLNHTPFYKTSYHPWLLDDPLPKTIVWGGRVQVNEDKVISANETLKILPGTQVIIAPGKSIISFGQVQSVGTKDKPIRILPMDLRFAWGVFAVVGHGADSSIFKNVIFEKGSLAQYERINFSGMLNIHYADDIRIESCRFRNNTQGDDVVHLAACDKFEFVENEIRQAFSDGLDCDLSDGIIVNNRIEDTVNDGIDIMTGHVYLINNEIRRANDKGISVGEHSAVIVTNNSISECNIGIALKDGSKGEVNNCEFNSNNTALSIYTKNSWYPGTGRAVIKNSKFFKNKNTFEMRDHSFVVLDHSTVDNPTGTWDGVKSYNSLVGPTAQGPISGIPISKVSGVSDWPVGIIRHPFTYSLYSEKDIEFDATFGVHDALIEPQEYDNSFTQFPLSRKTPRVKILLPKGEIEEIIVEVLAKSCQGTMKVGDWSSPFLYEAPGFYQMRIPQPRSRILEIDVSGRGGVLIDRIRVIKRKSVIHLKNGPIPARSL
ncbi:MAG: right-handed parallel beta-helix repeat-containing protein [Elusimicrobia bacterium]|nr:right-handed parallel beta-helix repeat-containing protein [Candidatus Obscuribacterium magneticum]